MTDEKTLNAADAESGDAEANEAKLNPASDFATDAPKESAKQSSDDITSIESTKFEVSAEQHSNPVMDSANDAQEVPKIATSPKSEDSDEAVQVIETVSREKTKRIIEGALFAADKPLSLQDLTQLFYANEAPGIGDFKEMLAELGEEYCERGVQLKEVSSGYRFQVATELGPWVSRLWEEKPVRYSRALLETLALVAYRQPLTRGEIEDIRGVSVSSHIMKSLLEREWVRVVGHRDVPGRPAMYATTRDFLDYFNLKNLDELPSLAEIRDLDKINEELELLDHVESKKDGEQGGEASFGDSVFSGSADNESGGSSGGRANTISNVTDNDNPPKNDQNKPKLSLHDITQRMERLRDSEVANAASSEQPLGENGGEVLSTAHIGEPDDEEPELDLKAIDAAINIDFEALKNGPVAVQSEIEVDTEAELIDDASAANEVTNEAGDDGLKDELKEQLGETRLQSSEIEQSTSKESSSDAEESEPLSTL